MTQEKAMNELYFTAYLKSGNVVRMKADDCYVVGDEMVFSLDDMTVGRFKTDEIEGWTRDDG